MTDHAGTFCTQSHGWASVRTTSVLVNKTYCNFSGPDCHSSSCSTPTQKTWRRNFWLLHNWYNIRLLLLPNGQTESMLRLIVCFTSEPPKYTCSTSKTTTQHIHTYTIRRNIALIGDIFVRARVCMCMCVNYWLFNRQHEHMGEKK